MKHFQKFSIKYTLLFVVEGKNWGGENTPYISSLLFQSAISLLVTFEPFYREWKFKLVLTLMSSIKYILLLLEAIFHLIYNFFFKVDFENGGHLAYLYNGGHYEWVYQNTSESDLFIAECVHKMQIHTWNCFDRYLVYQKSSTSELCPQIRKLPRIKINLE